jgi:hypothetical protein
LTKLPFYYRLELEGARLLAMISLAAALSLAPALTFAQTAGSDKVPRVSLSEITGTPGASLMVPFYFTPDPKTPLRSIGVDIEYVANSLQFQKHSRGAAAESANVEITTSVTEGNPDDKGIKRSTLHLKAELAGQAPATGLPDGLLAYLLFQISLEAKPFAVKMTTTVTSAESLATPPKPVEIAGIGREDGLVIVNALDVMPEATCFFFTH